VVQVLKLTSLIHDDEFGKKLLSFIEKGKTSVADINLN